VNLLSLGEFAVVGSIKLAIIGMLLLPLRASCIQLQPAVHTLENPVPGDASDAVDVPAFLLCRLTTLDKVVRLPAPVNHVTVFSHPLGRAALIKILNELVN
jgi:hypothetical protein